MINRIKKYTGGSQPTGMLFKGKLAYSPRKPLNKDELLDSFRKIIEDQAGMIAELEEKLQAKNDRMNRMIVKVRKLIALAEKMKGRALNGKKEG